MRGGPSGAALAILDGDLGCREREKKKCAGREIEAGRGVGGWGWRCSGRDAGERVGRTHLYRGAWGAAASRRADGQKPSARCEARGVQAAEDGRRPEGKASKAIVRQLQIGAGLAGRGCLCCCCWMQMRTDAGRAWAAAGPGGVTAAAADRSMARCARARGEQRLRAHGPRPSS